MSRRRRRREAPTDRPSPASWIGVAIAWTLVGVPLAWGIYITLEKALVLFR